MNSNRNEVVMAHLTQQELDDIVRKHEIYLKGQNGGARAIIKFKNLSGLSLSGRDLSHADFTGSCFIGANLSSGTFTSATFFACDMRRANLENACFVRADFRGAFVAGANLTGADLKSADLREGKIMEKGAGVKGHLSDRQTARGEEQTARTVFTGARLMKTNLSAVRAANADFADADMSNVTIQGADLKNANLEGANLSHSDLTGTDLRGANLRNSIMEKTVMAMVEKAGADFENAVTEKATGSDISELGKPLDQLLKEHAIWVATGGSEGKQLDLSGFDLRDLEDLKKYSLTAMHAVGANFLNQDFSSTEMQSAVLDESDFRDCMFVRADVRGSSLRAPACRAAISLTPTSRPCCSASAAKNASSRST